MAPPKSPSVSSLDKGWSCEFPSKACDKEQALCQGPMLDGTSSTLCLPQEKITKDANDRYVPKAHLFFPGDTGDLRLRWDGSWLVRGELPINVSLQKQKAIEERYLKSKQRVLEATSAPGVHDLDPISFEALFGSKEAGTARKVMITVAHLDDEPHGLIKRLVDTLGSANVMVLFTTNSDGNVGEDALSDRTAFAQGKEKTTLQILTKIGVPPENVRFLRASEATWYCGFIAEAVKKSGRAPKAKGFELMDDLATAAWRTASWIFSNASAFHPDVVISGDLLFTLQGHDMNYITTTRAINQYAKSEGRSIDFYVFPQQNRSNGKTYLYIYPPEEEATLPVLEVKLTKDEAKVRSSALWDYALSDWADFKLLVGYSFKATDRMKKNAILRFVNPLSPASGAVGVPQLDETVACPPPEKTGYNSFEGNDDHLGVIHKCPDDYRFLPELDQKIAAEGLKTLNPEELRNPKDPFEGLRK